jgi:hypothetical protein
MHRINNIQFNSCKVRTSSIITKHIISFMFLWYLLTEIHKVLSSVCGYGGIQLKKKIGKERGVTVNLEVTFDCFIFQLFFSIPWKCDK